MRSDLSRTFPVVTVQSVGLPRWLSGEESACNAGDKGGPLSQEGPLEEGAATHCSPGGLRAVGLERVGHD